jgi:cytidyltransferase-like protein
MKQTAFRWYNGAMEKVALAVMRLQPLHNGHKLLIDTALAEASIALIAIGSANKRDERNPFSLDERKAMIETLYKGETRLKVFGVRDIGAATKREWADFVLSEIARLELPSPTCYYAGDPKDGEWFAEVLPVRIVDRQKEGGGVSASSLREALANDADNLPIPEAIKKFLRDKL